MRHLFFVGPNLIEEIRIVLSFMKALTAHRGKILHKFLSNELLASDKSQYQCNRGNQICNQSIENYHLSPLAFSSEPKKKHQTAWGLWPLDMSSRDKYLGCHVHVTDCEERTCRSIWRWRLVINIGVNCFPGNITFRGNAKVLNMLVISNWTPVVQPSPKITHKHHGRGKVFFLTSNT